MVIELYRVRCPDCGIKTEKVPQLPSKAPFSKRFEEAVGLACESAAVRRVARQFGLASQHGARHRSALSEALGGGEKKAGLAADGRGRDPSGEEAEVPHRGEQPGDRRAVVVWAGAEEGDLDEFFEKQLSASSAARSGRPVWICGSRSGKAWSSGCRSAGSSTTSSTSCSTRAAVDEVRRAEFFRKGGAAREVVKGKRWLLLSRWVHLNTHKKRQLNALFALEPAGDEGVSAEGEPGPAVELHL